MLDVQRHQVKYYMGQDLWLRVRLYDGKYQYITKSGGESKMKEFEDVATKQAIRHYHASRRLTSIASETAEQVQQYWARRFPGATIHVYSQADQMRQDLLQLDGTHLLKAEYGVGKTKALEQRLAQILRQNPKATMLLISPRRALCQSLAQRFRFKLYYTEEHGEVKIGKGIDFATVQKLVITPNSLYRLPATRPFDVIVLDEVEGMLRDFPTGPLAKSFLPPPSTLFSSYFNRPSPCLPPMPICIQIQGLSSWRVFDHEESFHVHINLWRRSLPWKIIEISQKQVMLQEMALIMKWNQQQPQSAASPIRFWVFSDEKSFIRGVQALVQCYDPQATSLFVTAENVHDREVQQVLCHQPAITRLRYGGCSPAITAGWSVEQPHFHRIYAHFGTQSCSLQDCQQMIWRIRALAQHHQALEHGIFKYHITRKRGKPPSTNEKDLFEQWVSCSQRTIRLLGKYTIEMPRQYENLDCLALSQAARESTALCARQLDRIEGRRGYFHQEFEMGLCQRDISGISFDQQTSQDKHIMNKMLPTTIEAQHFAEQVEGCLQAANTQYREHEKQRILAPDDLSTEAHLIDGVVRMEDYHNEVNESAIVPPLVNHLTFLNK